MDRLRAPCSVRCAIRTESRRTYVLYRQMQKQMPIGEAAKAIGVSVDTLRRWEQAGKLRTRRDTRNRRLVPVSEVHRLTSRPDRHRTGSSGSARNRIDEPSARWRSTA